MTSARAQPVPTGKIASALRLIRDAGRTLDLFEAMFAIKSFAAAMTALWIALAIGLDRPYWAVITSYITALPLAGAVKSKSVFRAIGTVIGGSAAVILVPAFVNRPEALVAALGLWLAFCSYLSLLNRSPRSYIFALGGYTAAIIGFPSVASPGSIFTIALLRSQEVLLGIVCSTFAHTVLFPASTLRHTQRRAAAIFADIQAWLTSALEPGSRSKESDRRRLAQDLHDLHQLALHLSFEIGYGSHAVSTTRALQFELARLLPFIGGIDDRRRQIGDAMPAEALALGSDLRGAIATPDDADWADIFARIEALTPRLRAPLVWQDALLVNYLSRLATIMESFRATRTFVLNLQSQRSAGPKPSPRPKIITHRDHGIALRGALATFSAVAFTSAIWIATAWPDGATAVLFAAIWTMLFSNIDDARPALRHILLGTVVGTILALLYVGAILPRVTDFVTLVAVLAPAFLLIGSLIPRPRTAMFAIGLFNSFPAMIGLTNVFAETVPQVLNSAIAQIFGTAISVIFMTLFRLSHLHRGIELMVRRTRREAARRAIDRHPSPLSGWAYLVLDRIAVLNPRFTHVGIDPENTVASLLRAVRSGISIAELRQIRDRARPKDRRPLNLLMARIASFVPHHSPESERQMVRIIDRCLDRAVRFDKENERASAVVALVGLRRSLVPDLQDL